MRAWILPGLIASLCISTFADAQPIDDSHHDIQCLIAVSVLADNDDAKVKMTGMMAGLYFSGKIFGKDPDIDLASRVKTLSKTMDGGKAKTLLVECGAELKMRGQQLQDVGAILQREQGAPS